MKKLMIAVAAVACAAVANAANFNWSITAEADWDTGNAPLAANLNDSLYVFSAADWTGFDGTAAGLAALTALQGPVSYSCEDPDWAGYYGVGVGRTTIIEGADTLASLDVVFVDVAADNSGYMTMETTLAGSTPNGEQTYNDFAASTVAGAFGSEYTAFTTPTPPGPGPDPTPEPTSGLLMLVGLAGLALRRKQA